MDNSLREYVNRTGEAEVRVHFETDTVRIEDKEKHEISITETQARWLATELDKEFGGGTKKTVLEDRVLYFTGQVTEKTVIDTQKDLMRLADKWLQRDVKDRGHLTIFINTPGGYCHHGMALIDNIHHVRGLGIPVVGIVQGIAYSMGSVILQACSQRYLTKHARLMIHEVYSGTSGKIHDMEDDLVEAKYVQQQLAEIFAERNTAGHNDVKYWLRFFKPKDRFLSPQECTDLGLIEGVYDPLKEFEIKIKKA